MKSGNKKISKIIFATVSALIALFVIWTLGKPINPPWPLQTNIYQPKQASIDQDGNLSGLIDDGLIRLSFFNEKSNTTKVISNKGVNTEPCYYYNVCSYNNYTYAHEVTSDLLNPYIKTEKILQYNKEDGSITPIYEIDYDISKVKNKYPSILTLDARSDGIFLLKLNNNNNLELINIKEGQSNIVRKYSIELSSDRIYAACYNHTCDKVVISTYTNDLFQLDENGNIIQLDNNKEFIRAYPCILDDGTLLISDDIKETLYKKVDNDFITLKNNIAATSLKLENNKLIICDTETSSVQVYFVDTINNNSINFNEGKIYKNLHYSELLTFQILITFFAYLYIFIVAIIFIVKLINKIKSHIQMKTKIFIAMGVILIIVIMCLSVFFTWNIYAQAEKQLYNELKIAAQTYATSNKNVILDYYSKHNNKDKTDIEQKYLIEEIDKYVESYANAETELTINILSAPDTEVFMLNKENDNPESIGTYSVNKQQIKINSVDNAGIITASIDDDAGTNLSAIICVYDDIENPVAYVFASSLNRFLVISQIIQGISMFIILLIAACTITIIFIELYAAIHSIRKSFELKKKKNKNYSYYGCRILIFFNYLIYSLDTGLLVLIGQDMLSGNNFNFNITYLLSIPAVAYNIGATISVYFINVLMKKFTGSKLLIILEVLNILLEFICGYFILQGNFIMFCISKICLGFLNSVIYNIISALQYNVSDIKVQASIANDISLASVSACAIGTMVAGNLANVFGNISINIFAALLGLFFIAGVIWFIPNGYYLTKKNKKRSSKSSFKPIIKFLITPKMLFFILGSCVVGVLASQYSTILFPLFADKDSFNKSEIGNMIMLGTCVVFFINSMFKQKFSTANHTQFLIIAIAIITFSFLCFGLNDTIIWACFALVIIAFGIRICTISQKIVWIPYAKEKKMDESQVFVAVAFIKQIFIIICPAVMTLLIPLGDSNAAIIVGLFCLATLLLSPVVINRKK